MKTMAMNKKCAVTERNECNSSYIMLYGLVISVHTCFVHCISKSEITPSSHPSVLHLRYLLYVLCVHIHIYVCVFIYFTCPHEGTILPIHQIHPRILELLTRAPERNVPLSPQGLLVIVFNKILFF
jgi:hypothetical protein